jgi:hypothetical protein
MWRNMSLLKIDTCYKWKEGQNINVGCHSEINIVRVVNVPPSRKKVAENYQL